MEGTFEFRALGKLNWFLEFLKFLFAQFGVRIEIWNQRNDIFYDSTLVQTELKRRIVLRIYASSHIGVEEL